MLRPSRDQTASGGSNGTSEAPGPQALQKAASCFTRLLAMGLSMRFGCAALPHDAEESAAPLFPLARRIRRAGVCR